jgi:hypothetical protein
MAKKGGETIGRGLKYMWEKKGPLLKGTIAGILIGGILESSQSTSPPPQEVFSCTITQGDKQAECPDGIITIGKKTIKLGPESSRRDSRSGNAAIANGSEIFTVIGRGPATTVYESRLPAMTP